VECLESKGLQVIERNWRRSVGELDIIARAPDGTCVFCEVRSRTGTATGEALEAIGPRKQAQVIAVARQFLAEGDIPPGTTGYRFDVVAVEFTAENDDAQVIHIPRAFETSV